MSEPTVAELAVAAVVRGAVKQLYKEMQSLTLQPAFSARESLRGMLDGEYPGMTDLQPELERMAERFDVTADNRREELRKALQIINAAPDLTSEEIMKNLPEWAIKPVRRRVAYIFSNMEKQRIGG